MRTSSIAETAAPTQAASAPPALSDQTNSWVDLQSGNTASGVSATLQGIRADSLKNMPLDQKLELVLKKSAAAEKISYRALREISGFDAKLDRVFKDLSTMIGRVAGGQQAIAKGEPGESIFDEEDDESIFGR